MPKGGYRNFAGRPGWKAKTADRLGLDVRKLQREGVLKPATSFIYSWSQNGEQHAWVRAKVGVGGDCLTLCYQWTPRGGEALTIECPIDLITTPCHFGGLRTWFACPRCGRRCGVVYFGSPSGRYACRQCLNIAYPSQSQDKISRLWDRQRKIERKLSGGMGEWNRWQKPKGMHQKTFDHLRNQLYEIESEKDHEFYLSMVRSFPHLLKDLPNSPTKGE